jgi:flagellar biosynthesis protein FlhB
MSEEKTEQPTPRKLKKARDKGEVFKSTEVTQTVVFIALVGVAVLGLRLWLPLLHAEMLAWPARIAELPQAQAPQAWVLLMSAAHSAVVVMAWPLALVFGLAAAFGLLAAGLQVRGVLSGDPLAPKAERLNPGANLKRLFSTRNVYDVLKILVKVSLVGTAVYLTTKAAFPDWLAFLRSGGSAMHLSALLAQTLLAVAIACIAIYTLAAAVDYGHQFFEYIKQQRMSKDEVRREFKELEGDPYIKGYRRAIMRMMATEAPAGALSGARAVVTNPTHYAVALAFDAASGGLPSVVAKGVDRAAKKIREEATRLGLPIIEDRALARKLYAKVPQGQFITSDTFADVARLIARLPPVRGPAARGDMALPRP